MAYELNLMDAQERHREHPATFEVPSERELAEIQTNDFVKLGFLIDDPDSPVEAERMWVRVTEPGVGVLDNDPVYLSGLAVGARVPFELRHVLSIIKSQ